MVWWTRSQAPLCLGDRSGIRWWRKRLAARWTWKSPAGRNLDPKHSPSLNVGEHGSAFDPVTTVEPEDVVDEAHGLGMGDRSEHDHDGGPAGEDVDGSELVHLAHAPFSAEEITRAGLSHALLGHYLPRGIDGSVAYSGGLQRGREWRMRNVLEDSDREPPSPPELHPNYQAPPHVPQRFSPQGVPSPQRRTPRSDRKSVV